MHLLEIVAIRTIFNNYKNLGAIELQLQNKKFIIKMGNYNSTNNFIILKI